MNPTPPVNLEQAPQERELGKIRIFVSFDTENDSELYDVLVAQSGSPGFDFKILGGSERSSVADGLRERVRRRIGEADQVIVICGEHTEESACVGAELRTAQEEKTPYFLLWGRRELMCTKPIGAKPSDGMYSWTRQILQEQITFMSRRTDADFGAAIQRNATRKV